MNNRQLLRLSWGMNKKTGTESAHSGCLINGNWGWAQGQAPWFLPISKDSNVHKDPSRAYETDTTNQPHCLPVPSQELKTQVHSTSREKVVKYLSLQRSWVKGLKNCELGEGVLGFWSVLKGVRFTKGRKLLFDATSCVLTLKIQMGPCCTENVEPTESLERRW